MGTRVIMDLVILPPSAAISTRGIDRSHRVDCQAQKQVRTEGSRSHKKVTIMEQAWHIENPLCCPAVTALGIISGKWKPMILHMLSAGTMRFGQLRKNIPPVSQKMLTQQLRELEVDGIVSRTIYAEVPPKVEYSLTERGAALKPVLDSLYQWGQAHSTHALRPATTKG